MALYAPVTSGSGTLLATVANPPCPTVAMPRSRLRGPSRLIPPRRTSPPVRKGAATVPPPELVIKTPLTTLPGFPREEGNPPDGLASHPPPPAPSPKLMEPPGKVEQSDGSEP